MIMNKIIAIAAAMVAGVSMAQGIESANIVGYANVGLREGNIAQGPCFLPVSGETIDLTKVVVTGYDKSEGSEEEVIIQSLDASGRMVAGSMYSWIDSEDEGEVYYE